MTQNTILLNFGFVNQKIKLLIMKKLYILALISLPVLGFSQDFSFDILNDTSVSTSVGADVSVDINIVNHTLDTIELRWQLMAEFASVPSWEDFICEGDDICWPTTQRSSDILVSPSEDFEIYHHIYAKTNDGEGVSVLCVYDANDSANTVICSSFYVNTAADTIHGFTSTGVAIIVVDGDTFEMIGGQYVPLGLEETANAFASSLSQNAPNPAKDITVINYQLASSNGTLKFHDLTGKLVKEITLNGKQGQYTLHGELESGIYFYSLWENGAMIDSKRMQVID